MADPQRLIIFTAILFALTTSAHHLSVLYLPVMMGGTTPAPSNLIVDSFTDSDETLLDLHTPETYPVGSAWSDTTLRIIGNEVIEDHAGLLTSSIVSGEADTISIIEFRLARDGLAYYYPRYYNSTNYIEILVTETAFSIIKVEAGTPTTLDTEVVELDSMELYTLTVSAKGAALSANIDGSIVVSANSTFEMSVTTLGIGLNNAYMTSLNVTSNP